MLSGLGLPLYSNPSVGEVSYIKSEIAAFGVTLRRLDLAEIVENLYDAALRSSSRQTYKTGLRAYLRFMKDVNGGSALLYPFRRTSLSRTELALAFYMEYLILQPTIRASSTILGYEVHVKYMFRENGCDPEMYNTAFLGQVRKGIENVFPKQADSRKAFLLPNYLTRTSFRHVTTKQDVLARFATIIGFIGMLRPHTITELQASMITFVAVTGAEVIGKTRSHVEEQMI